MCEAHVIDEGARVGSCNHEADLTNGSVHNVVALVDELVGVDRERGDVPVLNALLRLGCGLAIVEEAVDVHAVVTVLQDSVAENVRCLVVLVLPNQRNPLAVTILERAGHDRPTVCALETILGGIAAEICFHFECSPFLLSWF